MDIKNKNKLQELIEKRQARISAALNFDQLFYQFSKELLPKVLNEINSELGKSMKDKFRIMTSDPYEFVKNRFFIQVELFEEIQNNDIVINEKILRQGLRFIGDDYNAKVEIFERYRNSEQYKLKKSIDISVLTEEYNIEELFLTFLSKAYDT